MATAPDFRWGPVICPVADGSSITVWTQDFSTYAQRLTASGLPEPGWPADNGLNVAPDAPVAPYMQCSPRTISDEAGGAFIVWHDQRNSGCQHSCWGEWKELYATHIGPDGRVLPGWSSAGQPIGSAKNWMLDFAGDRSGALEDFNTVLAPDGHGGFFAVWKEQVYPAYSGAVAGIHAQRVAGDGQLLWGTRGILVAQAPGIQALPALVGTPDGGAVLVWQDSREDSTAFRIYGQRLTPDGAPLWSMNGRPLSAGLIRNEQSPVIGGLSHGDVVVGWQAGPSPDSTVFLTQRLQADGTRRWPQDMAISGSLGRRSRLSAAVERAGAAWFAWVEGSPAAGGHIAATKLDEDGTPACGWLSGGNPVSSASDTITDLPLLVPTDAGGAYVAWLEGSLPRASRLTATGAVAAGWPLHGLVLSQSLWGGNQLTVAADGEQGAYVAWYEGSMPDDQYDEIRVQRLSRTGVWNGPLPNSDPVPDSCVKATKPIFAGFNPNPVRLATAAVSFVLALPGPVRLELYDLTGRRLAAQDFGSLGAGRHTLPLTMDNHAPPGVYFVRLTQSGRTATARGVILP